ncbi:MAG: acyl-CoA thioesterase [Planctomycetota bacterium]|nr:MAG: acyl-CoA thioesterase [Planctomycetota bacterium]REJ94589.1 MAG: acyl-CoA thioesterase [Planctomycetota bacterium]REK37529.1 MAG: acyl-CoA thioesterase [Planctomycetota bacterium]
MLHTPSTAAVFPYEHTVTPEEIEPAGNATCLAYLEWTRQAALGHSAAQGWPPQRYIDQGIAWTVRSHEIHYLKPAMLGQHVVCQTWVESFQKTRARRRYKIFRPEDETLLVVAETNWTLIDLKTFRPCRIPVELSEAFPVVPDDEGSDLATS